MPIAPAQFLDEPARRTPVMAEAEVVVLGGLSAPHLIFGNTRAQAYDMSAYKCAAAAMALATDSKPRAIDVTSLQAQLERDGAYLGRDVT